MCLLFLEYRRIVPKRQQVKTRELQKALPDIRNQFRRANVAQIFRKALPAKVEILVENA